MNTITPEQHAINDANNAKILADLDKKEKSQFLYGFAKKIGWPTYGKNIWGLYTLLALIFGGTSYAINKSRKKT